MLVEEYRKDLKRWMWNAGLIGFVVFAVFVWAAIYERRLETIFLGFRIFAWVLVGTFAIVSLHHIVVAYLHSKERVA